MNGIYKKLPPTLIGLIFLSVLGTIHIALMNLWKCVALTRNRMLQSDHLGCDRGIAHGWVLVTVWPNNHVFFSSLNETFFHSHSTTIP